MSDIQTKLENYLKDNEETDDFLPDEDTEMMNKMVDLIMNLDSENLSEDQVDEITEIIDKLADEGIDEAVAPRKVKISPQEKRERRRQYRRQRAQLKLKAKRFRKTTKFKRWKRMKERKVRQGKTATGKRIRKFL